MLRDLSAIPLRPHPELNILRSQPSPPVIRDWRGGSPEMTSPLSPYNFDPPMPGSRSPYSVRRALDTPRHSKTPKTPKTPHTTPTRHSMSRKSFGSLARRLSSLTSRHTASDTPPPMPPPYNGPPLFSLPAESQHSPEPLILGSYPQFSPSSFFRGYDALRVDDSHQDEVTFTDVHDKADVFVNAKGLGITPYETLGDAVPLRISPSSITSLPSPPPQVGLPPNPQPLFSRTSLFDHDVIEIAARGPLSDSSLSDNRESFDLGPMLFGSPSSTESYEQTNVIPFSADISAQPSSSSTLARPKLSHRASTPSLHGSSATLLTIPTIPSLPFDRLASSRMPEDTIDMPILPALRQVISHNQPHRTSYIAPPPLHASPHLPLSPLLAPASPVSGQSPPALLSPPLPLSPEHDEYSSQHTSPRSERDPLAELMAVAAELKSMVRPPSLSGHIMLQTPSPTFTTTGLTSPRVSARRDAKALAAEFEAAGERVLEILVHGEDVPAIVVVRPDSMHSIHARAFYPGGAEPMQGADTDLYLLAPPLVDERGRVDWYGHDQDDLPAYDYSEPLVLPKPSMSDKSRVRERQPTTTEAAYPVQRTHASLGRKRRGGQTMTSPPPVHQQRVLTRPVQSPQLTSRGAFCSPPLHAPNHPSDVPRTRHPVTMTPRKGSLLKRALRLASGGSDADLSAAYSRNRTQTGFGEATGAARALSDSVRSRGGRTEGGRANWRTLFERGTGKSPVLSAPGKECIGSPRPLSPVVQWGWAEQGVLVGVI